MQRFWLDANVFIEAKRRYYRFHVAPGFWEVFDRLSEPNVIKSPVAVFYELTEGNNDNLAEWARDRRHSGFFVEPDDVVQEQFRRIAEYVSEEYPSVEAKVFLDGADPWVIAHAKCDMGSVVTVEKPSGPDSTHVKIPNVCHYFEVEWIDTFVMLEELGVKLILGRKGWRS